MKRILVVDDDQELLDTIAFLLDQAGYQVKTAMDGRALFDCVESKWPNLVILDVGLGEESGFELAMVLRKRSSVPIIMLTGRDQENDRVVGLELGADDYITKPYSSAELLARIKSVLRRSDITKANAVRSQAAVAHFENWRCDISRRTLESPAGAEIPLTSGEFSLLAAFVQNPQRVLSREQLLDLTNRENTFDRSIDVQIMRLRKKTGSRCRTSTTDSVGAFSWVYFHFGG